MQKLTNLPGKVRGNLVSLGDIYRVDIPASNVRSGTNSCLNSMRAENEKRPGKRTSDMFTNDLDQVGGPHQFCQTTARRYKERFMPNFYDQRFPSHNKSEAVARCARGFDKSKAALHCQAHRDGGQK